MHFQNGQKGDPQQILLCGNMNESMESKQHERIYGSVCELHKSVGNTQSEISQSVSVKLIVKNSPFQNFFGSFYTTLPRWTLRRRWKFDLKNNLTCRIRGSIFYQTIFTYNTKRLQLIFLSCLWVDILKFTAFQYNRNTAFIKFLQKIKVNL